jgi:AcrR family transcriptional regulator
MAVFAERGVAGATIRGIADRAGVSPALVQHHFGTKDGLRAACDDYVVDYLRDEARSGIDDGRIGEAGYVAQVYASAPPLMRYLARALVDGSPAAATVFDEMVGLTEAYLADRPGHSDPHTRAVVYTAMRLGVTVLHKQVSRALGEDVFGSAAAPRVGRATLDVTAPGMLPDGLAERARAGLDRFEEGEER